MRQYGQQQQLNNKGMTMRTMLTMILYTTNRANDMSNIKLSYFICLIFSLHVTFFRYDSHLCIG